MNTWVRSRVSAAALCSLIVGCAEEAPAPGLRGYEHTFAHSRFNTGDVISEMDQFEMHKVVGSVGTFSTELISRAVVALPNVPFPDPLFGVYPGTADDQNVFVRSYFVAGGLPDDQIASITADQAGLVEADGSMLQGWWSILNRGWNGVSIDDSTATAAFDASGQASGEQVYWPEISEDVLNQARTFQKMLSDPAQKASYTRKLPASSRDPVLVIRHTSWFWKGAFRAIACCRGASPGGLCFDINGQPAHLPDEDAPSE